MLDARITIEAETRTVTASGGATLTWSPVAVLWANVKPLSGSEKLEAEKLTTRITHQVTIRHRTDITTAHRIRVGTQTFRIESIADVDFRHEWLELTCEEVAP